MANGETRLAGGHVREAPGSPVTKERRTFRCHRFSRFCPVIDKQALELRNICCEPPVASRTLHLIAKRRKRIRRELRRLRPERPPEPLVDPLMAIHQLTDGLILKFFRRTMKVTVVRQRKQDRCAGIATPTCERLKPALGDEVEQRGCGDEVPAFTEVVGRGGERPREIDQARFDSIRRPDVQRDASQQRRVVVR